MRIGDGVSHGRERPCSLAFGGHFAMFHTHTAIVVKRVGVLSSLAQRRTSRPKREIREPGPLAGPSALAQEDGAVSSEEGGLV